MTDIVTQKVYLDPELDLDIVLFNIIYGCIGETYKDKWSL